MDAVLDHAVSQKLLMVVVIVSITWSCSCLVPVLQWQQLLQQCCELVWTGAFPGWNQHNKFWFTVLSVTVQTVLLKVQLNAAAGRAGKMLKPVSLTEKEKKLVVEKERTFCWWEVNHKPEMKYQLEQHTERRKVWICRTLKLKPNSEFSVWRKMKEVKSESDIVWICSGLCSKN